jgi:hypothetical protein
MAHTEEEDAETLNWAIRDITEDIRDSASGIVRSSYGMMPCHDPHNPQTEGDILLAATSTTPCPI